MDFSINFKQIASAFIVLFALIDVLGSVPIFLNFRKDDRKIEPFKAATYSFTIMVAFLFVGNWILNLFGVTTDAFAVAGALVIFIISIEMIFGVEIFKNDAPGGSATLVPIVFPLIAGPGTFTALLSMRSGYSDLSLIVAVFLNMVLVYVVLRNLDMVKRIIGIGGVYVLRKFFGIILMAIAVKLFTENFNALWGKL